MSEPLIASNADVAAMLNLRDDEPEATPQPGQWIYLDVRTCEEFSLGHVPGAYNVPLKLGGLAGMVDNTEFVSVMTRAFDRSTPLIIGCRSGVRARTALAQLREAGFSQVRLHEASFGGCRDAFGRLTPGWQGAGYAVASSPLAGRTYESLKDKALSEASHSTTEERGDGGGEDGDSALAGPPRPAR